MISIPGRTDHGIKTKKLVEMVDLFPTLVEAAGYDPLSLCPENSNNTQSSSHHINLCTEGLSLLPLTENPNKEEWKGAVFWQYPRSHKINKNVYRRMGYVIRTDRYRYTEWVNITHLGGNAYSPNWGQLAGEPELYDLEIDPQENINL